MVANSRVAFVEQVQHGREEEERVALAQPARRRAAVGRVDYLCLVLTLLHRFAMQCISYSLSIVRTGHLRLIIRPSAKLFGVQDGILYVDC